MSILLIESMISPLFLFSSARLKELKATLTQFTLDYRLFNTFQISVFYMPKIDSFLILTIEALFIWVSIVLRESLTLDSLSLEIKSTS
jgi:hypothetical protein